jgi:hypothetical protein
VCERERENKGSWDSEVATRIVVYRYNFTRKVGLTAICVLILLRATI